MDPTPPGKNACLENVVGRACEDPEGAGSHAGADHPSVTRMDEQLVTRLRPCSLE